MNLDPMKIGTREELADFVSELARDLEENAANWENITLTSYLDALARYLDDLDGWCRNNEPGVDPEVSQWRLFAVAMLGATVYE